MYGKSFKRVENVREAKKGQVRNDCEAERRSREVGETKHRELQTYCQSRNSKARREEAANFFCPRTCKLEYEYGKLNFDFCLKFT